MRKFHQTRLERGVRIAQKLVLRDYRRSGLSYSVAAKQAGLKKQALYWFVTSDYKRWPTPRNMRLLAEAKWVGKWSRICLHQLCDFVDGGGTPQAI